MLQVQSLGALAWYVRGACRTGKKARMDITTAPRDLTTGFGAISWPVSPPLGNKSQLSKGLPPKCDPYWILSRKIHGQNLLVESIRT